MLAGIDMVGGELQGRRAGADRRDGRPCRGVFLRGVVGQPHVKAGKLRALGVTTTRRSTALPDVPTIAEAGVPGYEVDAWYGLLAPAATPPAAIARFNRDLAQLLSTAEMKERLLTAGVEAHASTPAEFRDLIARDITRWAEVVKKAKIPLE